MTNAVCVPKGQYNFFLRCLPLLMGKDSHYDNGGRVIYLVLI